MYRALIHFHQQLRAVHSKSFFHIINMEKVNKGKKQEKLVLLSLHTNIGRGFNSQLWNTEKKRLSQKERSNPDLATRRNTKRPLYLLCCGS